MILNDSDYSRLLPIRDEVFPTFDSDQECAAQAIIGEVSSRIEELQITSVVELGCGTAEILDAIRRHLAAYCRRPIRYFGVDCCAEEIAIARNARPNCEYFEERAEEFVGSVVSGRSNITLSAAFLLCVGHTIPHFHSMTRFLNDVAAWGPALAIFDFYEEWDSVVQHFNRVDAAPIRELKNAPQGKRVTHMLTTKQNPDDVDRVLRGIETFRDGRETVGSRFWTTQYRRGTEWFLSEMRRRGYDLDKTLSYKGGYGPMKAFVLSKAIVGN